MNIIIMVITEEMINYWLKSFIFFFKYNKYFVIEVLENILILKSFCNKKSANQIYIDIVTNRNCILH